MTDRLPNGRFRNDAPRPAKGAGHGGAAKGAGLWGPAKGPRDYKGEPMVPGYDPVRHADVGASRRRSKAVKEEWAALHKKVAAKLSAAVEANELKPGELVAAFTATGNRAHGQPVANLKVASVRPEDMTDDELVAIAAGGGEAAPATESDTPVADTLG